MSGSGGYSAISSAVQYLARKLRDVTGVPRCFVHQYVFELRMSLIRLKWPYTLAAS